VRVGEREASSSMDCHFPSTGRRHFTCQPAELGARSPQDTELEGDAVLDDTFANVIVALLKQHGQMTVEELLLKLTGKERSEVIAALAVLLAGGSVQLSPRKKYYVRGHLTPAAAATKGIQHARSAVVEFGVVSASGTGFAFDGRIVMPGDILTNQELMDAFRVNNIRGIRVSKATNSIVIVSSVSNSLYRDRWQDGVFSYTGEGRSGDQSMKGGNGAIADSVSSRASLILFFKRKPNTYEFQGEVRLSSAPVSEQQPDEAGLIRRVWVFPLSAI